MTGQQDGTTASSDDDSSRYGYLSGFNDGSSLYMKIDGCAWGIAAYSGGGSGDNDVDLGCMENDSEDGTTSWYMMSNCRRAQVAYSLYSSNNCNSNNRRASFVTKDGVAAFAEILAGYTSAFDDDDNELNFDDFPICEEYDGDDDGGSYYGVGCNEDGSFTIAKFSDAYCLQYVESMEIRDDDYYYDDDNEFAFVHQLNSKLMDIGCTDTTNYASYFVPYSEPCTSLDSALCGDFQSGNSIFSKTASAVSNSPIAMTWSNKLKYVLGAGLLLASGVMFLAVLFLNRRKRRRAMMMHRRYRSAASRSATRRDDTDSRSRSRSRNKKRSSSRRSRRSGGGRSESDRGSKRSKSRTSKSRTRSKSRQREVSEDEKEDAGGIYT